MRRARHNQRDLFHEVTQAAALRPDLRAELTPLLQALLAEAACGKPRQAELDHPDGEEAGDDEDHA